MNAVFDWTIVWIFICIVLLLAFVIAVLLVYDGRQKQKVYSNFDGNERQNKEGLLGEFIVVLSQKLEFLYSLPQYMCDPLFDDLNKGRSFQDILPSKDWARLKLYLNDVEKHAGIPFVFSYKQENDKVIWFEMHCSVNHFSVDEMRYVCLFKNITNTVMMQRDLAVVRKKLDCLMQNTGDLLWMFDMEKRVMSLLSPILDDDGKPVPGTMGSVNMDSFMPKEDFFLLERLMNECVMKSSGFVNENVHIPPVKLRCIGANGNLVWYEFRGHLACGDDEQIVVMGAARKLSPMVDSSLFENVDERVAVFEAVSSLPTSRLFVVDRNFVVKSCNQSFALDCGRETPEAVVGNKLGEISHAVFGAYFFNAVSEAFEEGECRSVSTYLKDEKIQFWFNSFPVKKSGNVVERVVGFYMCQPMQDIIKQIKSMES